MRASRAVPRGRERGFVLVYFALILTVLMAMAGFALDVGNWYVVAQKEQKAADAAALAGVIYLPQPVSAGNPSYDRAVALAHANGFGSGVTVSAMPNIPTQLKVSVTQTVNNPFAGIVGYRSQTITRSAVAEYEAPVSMGSPGAIFGNEPINPATETAWNNISGFQPNAWANVMGPRNPKSSGDAIQAGACSGGSVDGCVMPQTANPGDNIDYSTDGYFYRVTVPAAEATAAKAAGYQLAIEVYDPAMVEVGNHCDQGQLWLAAGYTTSGGTTAPGPAVNPYATAADAKIRYGAGDTSNTGGKFTDANGLWCSGDNSDGLISPITTYTVHQDTNPYAPNTTPVVNSGGCAGQQFGSWAAPGSGNGYYDLLNAASGSYDAKLARVFRQWVPICIFDPSTQPAGDYFLQIRTNTPPYVATNQPCMSQTFTVAPGGANVSNNNPSTCSFPQLPNTGNSNRFAIRAGWVDPSTVSYSTAGINQFPGGNADPTTFVGGYGMLANNAFKSSHLSSGAGLSISGTRAMGMYANVAPGAAAPNFYMARVLPGGTGQVLRIRLWDIGDGAGAGTTLTFTLKGGSVPCIAQLHDGGTYGAPVVSISTGGSTCSFDVYGAGNPNGGWFTIDINIPMTYTCITSNPIDCWVKMAYVPVGSALDDTTTWAAQLLGSPVRLVS